MSRLALIAATAVILSFFGSAHAAPAEPAIDWLRLYGTPGTETANAIAVGPDGELYVLGDTRAGPDGIQRRTADLFLMRLDPDGAVVWSKHLGGRGNESAAGLAVAPDGAVYVVGTSWPDAPGQSDTDNSDVLIARFTSDGDLRWETTFGGCALELAGGIAVASDGAVYVTGIRTPGDACPDNERIADGTGAPLSSVFVLRYAPNGQRTWARSFSRTNYTFGNDVAADKSGVYVVGSNDGLATPSAGPFVLKLSAAGKVQWSRTIRQHGWIDATRVELDGHGALYVAGFSFPEGIQGGAAIGLIRFTLDGTRRWSRTFDSLNNQFPGALASLVNGSIVVAGSRDSRPANLPPVRDGTDGLVLVVSGNGDLQSTTVLAGRRGDWASGAAAAQPGGFYVTGWSNTPTLEGESGHGRHDAFVARLH